MFYLIASMPDKPARTGVESRRDSYGVVWVEEE